MAFRFKGRWAVLAVGIILALVVAVAFLVNQPSKPSDLNPSQPSTQIPTGNETNTQPKNQTPATQSDQNLTNAPGPYVDWRIDRELAKGEKSLWIVVDLELDGKDLPDVAKELQNELGKEIWDVNLNPFRASFRAFITPTGLEMLKNNPYVSKIYYNSPGSLTLDTSVPLINATLVWNLNSSYSGTGKTICLIDSGVNKSHAGLQGKVIAEHCFCDIPFPFGGCCPNGSTELGGNGSAQDDFGHGTHVAGIIASQDATYKGVAPNSSLVVVRVTNSSGTLFSLDDVGRAIDWCRNNSANYSINVISGSLGDDVTVSPPELCTGVLDDELNNAYQSNIASVFSPNDTHSSQGINYPACLDQVISVGNSWKDDTLNYYFPRASNLDLVAPGTSIQSLRWDPDLCLNQSGNSCSCNGTYMTCSGTSMAVPHVSAAASLLLGLKPDLTPLQIREVLNITGKPISDTGYSNLTFSRIDVYKAIMAVNASLLQVSNLSELYSNHTQKIFDFRILNANLSNITNISWQVRIENGTTINSTLNFSLLQGQSLIALFEHNYSKPTVSDLNVTATATNLVHSRNTTVYAGDLIVADFVELNTSGLQKTYEFKVITNKTTNLTGINWSFDFGDGTTIYANQLTTLAPGNQLFVLIQRTYASLANRIVNATAFTTSRIASRIRYVTYLNVSEFKILNSSFTKRIFGFNITNLYTRNHTGVLWNLTFGNNASLNGTLVITLIPDETAFVLTEYNYTSSGTFIANASAKNGTLLSSQNITISVT